MNAILAIEIKPVCLIRRRQILERDEPVDFKAVLSEIRRLGGWGTSDLCFILCVNRSTLHYWETRRDAVPNYEDGRAIIKLWESLK